MTGAFFDALVDVLAAKVGILIGQLPSRFTVQAVVRPSPQTPGITARLVAVTAQELVVIAERLVELNGTLAAVLSFVSRVAAALPIAFPRPVALALSVSSAVSAFGTLRAKVSVGATHLHPVHAEELLQIRFRLLSLEPPVFDLRLHFIGQLQALVLVACQFLAQLLLDLDQAQLTGFVAAQTVFLPGCVPTVMLASFGPFNSAVEGLYEYATRLAWRKTGPCLLCGVQRGLKMVFG